MKKALHQAHWKENQNNISEVLDFYYCENVYKTFRAVHA